MPLALSCEESASVSIGIYKPRPLYTTNDVVDCSFETCKYLERTGCVQTAAILKSLSDNESGWVAVYAIWETGTDEDTASNKHSGVDAFESSIASVAETVNISWCGISCWECKGSLSFPQLSKGDVVHLREIIGEPERQEELSYACLAILKSYFQNVDGLLSCTFYKSLDGTRITGLGVWENVEAAFAFMSLPEGSPAEPYWRSLGAKLKYGIYEVAYATGEQEGLSS